MMWFKTHVVITVDFDWLHEGHIDHIQKAASTNFGNPLFWLVRRNYVTVIVNSDDYLFHKRGKILQSEKARVRIAKSIRWVDEVVVARNDVYDISETILKMKPDVFAKGGDRTPDNMPEAELAACKLVGCRIVYGVGDRLNSSSRLMKCVD